MPPKHSLLFSALALVLAILLLNAQLMPAYAIPVILIPIAIAVITTIGWIGTFIYYNYVANRPETPGVSLDSYATQIFYGWKVEFDNLLRTIDFIIGLFSRFDLYFIRRAEFMALDELNYTQPTHRVMRGVVNEICMLQKEVINNIKKVFGDIDNSAETLFTGTASTYMVMMVGGWGINQKFSHTSAEFDEFKLAAYGTPEVVWECDKLTYYKASDLPAQSYDLEKYVVIGGSISDILIKSPDGVSVYAVRLTKGGQDGYQYYMDTVELKTGDYSLKNVLLGMIARFSEIYGQAYDFAKAYHQVLRMRGYTDKSQVPNTLVCPPPDVLFYDANELVQKAGGNWQELASIYLAALSSMGDHFDKQVGCLGGGGVTATTTVITTAYTTVISGTTTTITTTYSTTYTYTNTTVTTITTTIDGTTTTYVTTLTNTYTTTGLVTTTYTTVIGGQTLTVTTTQTGIAYVTPAGLYVPNIFTRLQNVTVILPGGSQEYLAEIVLLDAAESITFRVGECTQLNSPITALVSYPDGRVRVVIYPGNTTICPGKIIKPGGEEVTNYTYEEKPLDQWVREQYEPEQPEYLQTKDRLGQMIELLVMILPLILVVALIGGIKSLAEGGRFRYVKPEKIKANPG